MKILVLGATGIQGTPTVRELIEDGHEVTGFTLPNDPKTDYMKELGVEMIFGNLLEADDLYNAMLGKDAVVFIPVIPTAGNPIPELNVGFNVITAAEKAGINYLVHTSVNRGGEHESFERWGREFWESYRMYWLGKSYVIDLVKACRIPHWTILKPAYMMDSFLPPKVMGMYPQLVEGKLVSARNSDTKVTMMCGDDIGKVIAQAFKDFDHFDGKEIDLAGDSVTMNEVTAAMSEVTGKKVTAVCKTKAELMEDDEFEAALKEVYKDFPGMDVSKVVGGTTDAFEWDNINGYQVDIDKANSHGVRLSTFKEWAARHKDEFAIG